MGEGETYNGICKKCGGFPDTPDDVSPSLWCDCPTTPVNPAVGTSEYEDDEDWSEYDEGGEWE